MPSSARSTAGWLLPTVPLASTWLLLFHCWHAVLPAVLNSLWIPTLDLSLTAATGRMLRFLLTSLTPTSPGALRSTLSLVALRSTRQQVTIPVFREAITAPLPCCGCIHVMRLYMHSFLRSERGCSVTQHQISARQSACTHEKEDLPTSQFVRVIYSSHIVNNRVVIVSLPREKSPFSHFILALETMQIFSVSQKKNLNYACHPCAGGMQKILQISDYISRIMHVILAQGPCNIFRTSDHISRIVRVILVQGPRLSSLYPLSRRET